MVELNKDEKQIVVSALGTAIERQVQALETCIKEEHASNPRLGEITKAIRERQRTLYQLETLRQPLTQVSR
jgi:hypothetical protein